MNEFAAGFDFVPDQNPEEFVDAADALHAGL